MNTHAYKLIDDLSHKHSLSQNDYEFLMSAYTPELAEYAAVRAHALRERVWGMTVFARGLIEISNICKNDCLYCGIRAANTHAERYRLSPEQILDCVRHGYEMGFRSYVLQGGEDPWFSDERLVPVIAAIKSAYPDCAVTLSLGERSRESYKRLFEAGAERYLLRHETASATHYSLLHPVNLTLEHRLQCAHDLREVGFIVGLGFMVGSPGQSSQTLAADLKLIEDFKPSMCGIGPFVPHRDTPFAHEPAGSSEFTCYLLSLLRLMRPGMLIPATTALGTLHPEGRERGLWAGANVVMPNLSPKLVRKKYELYNNKVCDGDEAAEAVKQLRARLMRAGFELVLSRGDPKDDFNDEAVT